MHPLLSPPLFLTRQAGTMEGSQRERKRKRESPPSPPRPRHPDAAFFPLVIASCSNIRSPYGRQILEQLLDGHLAFVRGIGGADVSSLVEILPPGLLSVLPLLLNQTHKVGIAVLAAEMVGAVALRSLDANEGIASDGETVRAVVAALGSRSRRVAMAACNAVLDLAAGTLGRERLRESLAVEKLWSVFCLVVTVPALPVHSCRAYKEKSNSFIMGYMKDRFPSSLLDAAIALINTCNSEFLEQVPGEVSRRFLFLLKHIWARYSNQNGNMSATKYDLAETIFRLSMNQISYTTYTPDLVRRSIFGNQYDFENFILSYWEKMPILLSNASRNESIIFNCFDLSSRTIDAAMDSILQSLVSCPPITSDESDILSFLEEVKGVLGSPMVYGQDIRVVKTQELLSGSRNENVKKEVHYFNNCTGLNSDDGLTFSYNHIQKCKEAVHSGYTVALRGLEFRSKKIAGLSDGLAALFGQPSVGANIYLTPPNSQGLSRHYDDHCVFVCQLLGTKRWIVFPQSSSLLPRLYETTGRLSCSDLSGNYSQGREFFLQEGDILYIPRGCPHEAYTTDNEMESQIDGSTFSLHLTLGIEVEPPFEWEGYAHVALHCWNQKQKEEYWFIDCTPRIPNFMVIDLLHIAIRLIGDNDPAFRKACLVAASLQSENGRVDHLQNFTLLQKSIFGNVIDCIDVQSNFMEAFSKIEVVVHEKDDISLQWLRWLWHLSHEGNGIEKFDFNDMLKAFEEFLLLARGRLEAVETIFMQIKHRFCRSITFEDVRKSFETLQKKYKKTRRQYMNGMLALHSTS